MVRSRHAGMSYGWTPTDREAFDAKVKGLKCHCYWVGRSNIYRLNKICDLFFMFPLQWEILDSNLSKYKVDPSNCELPMPSKKHLTQFCRIGPISPHMHNSKGALARTTLDTVTITGMEGSTPNLRKGSSKPLCGAVVPCYIAWLWIGPRLFVWSHCKVPSKKWKVWK